jgi:hypothetical protein
MAFTGNFMCTSFKTELLYGAHDFDAATGDTFKIALYTSSATLNAATTAYSATNEVSGTRVLRGRRRDFNPGRPYLVRDDSFAGFRRRNVVYRHHYGSGRVDLQHYSEYDVYCSNQSSRSCSGFRWR